MKKLILKLLRDDIGFILLFILSANYSRWAIHRILPAFFVFFHSTYNTANYVTHVGIYVGNNRMYHAGNPIGYADLNTSYWQSHLIGAGRIITQ